MIEQLIKKEDAIINVCTRITRFNTWLLPKVMKIGYDS